MKLFTALLLTWVGTAFSNDVVHYDGYKVYQIYPKTLEETIFLNKYERNETFDFWKKPRILGAPVDLMVTPASQSVFEKDMESHGMEYKVLIHNVDEIAHQENIRLTSRANIDGSFTEFMRHNEINSYLRRLAADYPKIVKLEVLGKSFEGRDLILIRISSGGTDKPTIFIDATIHAREWIAGSMALYIINQLVENPENRALYKDVDWAIIPIANPDGYEYTHTTDRFWRKTGSIGKKCDGADANRNFDFHWGGPGSDADECSEVYRGAKPFSEPETKVLGKYLTTHKTIKLYLTLHSYGRQIIFPWCYTTDLPSDNDQLVTLAKQVNKAIKAAGGTSYEIGTASKMAGLAAGCSEDYAKGAAGIKMVYGIELPGDGDDGFSPPASRILSIVKETWGGFKVFQKYVQDTFVDN